MDLVYKIYIAVIIFGISAMLLLIWRTWKNLSAPGAVPFFWLSVALCFWLLTSTADWMTVDQSSKIIINKLGYLGVLTIPVTWLLFAYEYSGMHPPIRKVYVAALAVIPVFLLCIVWFGEFWQEMVFTPQGQFILQEVNFGPWLFLMAGYSYLLILIGAGLILRHYLHTPEVEIRRQDILMLVSVVAQSAINLAFVLGFTQIDYTVLGFSVTAWVCAWALDRYNLFDPLPVAHSLIDESVPSPIMVVNRQRRVVFLNRAARTLWKITPRFRTGYPLEQFFEHGEDLLDRVEHENLVKTDFMIEENGKNRYFIMSTSRLDKPENKLPVGYYIVLTEITAIKAAEAELKIAFQSEKQASVLKSRFIQTASHEFRTPLAVIQSSAESIERYGGQWTLAHTADHARRIQQSVQQLTGLLDGLATAEPEHLLAPHPERVDVPAFCSDLLAQMEIVDQARHPLRLDNQIGDFVVRIDQPALLRVLNNLLTNALKFSPEGKPVTLTLSRCEIGLCITVEDQGIGIPVEDIPHLGEAFYRATNAVNLPGSGLGLKIVKDSLSALGGSIQYDSLEHSGTRVIVNMPLAPDKM